MKHRQSAYRTSIGEQQINRTELQQYPPFPTLVRNEYPRYPLDSVTTPGGAKLKVISQNDPYFQASSIICTTNLHQNLSQRSTRQKKRISPRFTLSPNLLTPAQILRKAPRMDRCDGLFQPPTVPNHIFLAISRPVILEQKANIQAIPMQANTDPGCPAHVKIAHHQPKQAPQTDTDHQKSTAHVRKRPWPPTPTARLARTPGLSRSPSHGQMRGRAAGPPHQLILSPVNIPPTPSSHPDWTQPPIRL